MNPYNTTQGEICFPIPAGKRRCPLPPQKLPVSTVARLSVQLGGAITATATGFIVGVSEGRSLVLSSLHAISNVDINTGEFLGIGKITATFYEAKIRALSNVEPPSNITFACGVLSYDVSGDVCWLRTQRNEYYEFLDTQPALRFVSDYSRTVEPGSACTIISNSNTINLGVAHGTVWDPSFVPALEVETYCNVLPCIVTTCCVGSGASGGLILNAHNEIIGMVQWVVANQIPVTPPPTSLEGKAGMEAGTVTVTPLGSFLGGVNGLFLSKLTAFILSLPMNHPWASATGGALLDGANGKGYLGLIESVGMESMLATINFQNKSFAKSAYAHSSDGLYLQKLDPAAGLAQAVPKLVDGDILLSVNGARVGASVADQVPQLASYFNAGASLPVQYLRPSAVQDGVKQSIVKVACFPAYRERLYYTPNFKPVAVVTGSLWFTWEAGTAAGVWAQAYTTAENSRVILKDARGPSEGAYTQFYFHIFSWSGWSWKDDKQPYRGTMDIKFEFSSQDPQPGGWLYLQPTGENSARLYRGKVADVYVFFAPTKLITEKCTCILSWEQFVGSLWGVDSTRTGPASTPDP